DQHGVVAPGLHVSGDVGTGTGVVKVSVGVENVRAGTGASVYLVVPSKDGLQDLSGRVSLTNLVEQWIRIEGARNSVKARVVAAVHRDGKLIFASPCAGIKAIGGVVVEHARTATY